MKDKSKKKAYMAKAIGFDLTLAKWPEQWALQDLRLTSFPPASRYKDPYKKIIN